MLALNWACVLKYGENCPCWPPFLPFKVSQILHTVNFRNLLESMKIELWNYDLCKCTVQNAETCRWTAKWVQNPVLVYSLGETVMGQLPLENCILLIVVQTGWRVNGQRVIRLRNSDFGPCTLWHNSRWCHWNFSLTWSFRSHYGPGVDSASGRYEYQEYFLWVKSGRCIRPTTLPPSWAIVT